MRSNEERIAEVKRRIEKREREERLHRSRITGCLLYTSDAADD